MLKRDEIFLIDLSILSLKSRIKKKTSFMSFLLSKKKNILLS